MTYSSPPFDRPHLIVDVNLPASLINCSKYPPHERPHFVCSLGGLLMGDYCKQHRVLLYENLFNNLKFSPVWQPLSHQVECVSCISQLVNEFLADPRATMAPTTFRMDSLFQEVQDIERTRMRHLPATGMTKSRRGWRS